MRDNLDVNRRELIGAVARWSVPTVVSITLGARVLEAKASCPPCQRKQGTTCRACSVSNVLNCRCEPCLGPPYCASVSGLREDPATGAQAPGSSGLRTPSRGASGQNPDPDRVNMYLQLQRQRQMQQSDPFSRPMYRDGFGTDRNQNPFGRDSRNPPSLYDRLRSDTLSRRRP